MDPFVFFDLGNVLVNFDHEYAVQQLATLAEREPDAVRRVLFGSQLQNQYETGLLDDCFETLGGGRRAVQHLTRRQLIPR